MEKFSKAFIFLIIIGFAYLVFKGDSVRTEIKKNGKDTICKFTLCKPSRKRSSAFVKYYVDDKLYRTNCGSCPENCDEKLNKFFPLKYLSENPNQIIVDFSNEVKDEDLIRELETKLEFKYWLEH